MKLYGTAINREYILCFQIDTYIILIINLLYLTTTNREYVLNASKLNVKLDF